MITKQDARNKKLRQRDLIPLPTRCQKSRLICDQFAAKIDELTEQAPCEQLRFAAYEPMRSEVDVHPLLNHCYHRGWRVHLPCMVKEAAEAPAHMVFFAIPQERLNVDRPAFLDHPAKPYLAHDLSAEGWHPTDVSTFHAVAVPMVAFDNANMRLGYGGGNYDRFLPRLSPNCFVAGVAFEEQRADHVPTEPHDLALPTIFTA